MSPEDFRRKLTAIFSADVEGYSRLMGEDELATVQTLTSYKETMRKLIKHYRGRVVDSTGDNLLAEFASVVDAVQCAVEVQQVLNSKNDSLPENRRMFFRIGINLGDVIAEGDRIFGDGVNIAARIESLAEGGGVCISGSAFEQIENKLALGYQYVGEHTVKNITKPVKVYKVPMGPVEAKKKVAVKGWRKVAIAGVAILILAGAAGVLWHYYFRLPPIEPASEDRMAFPLPDKPSIAVLPFNNVSGDEKYDFVADGMTEDIITALARFNRLFVIARNSTFTYKGKPVKVQQVAEDLGVRYVLEGSVHVSGDKIRVTAQLIDATTGRHVWVERFDRELKDVFQLQDEVTRKLVGSLVGKLDRATTAKALLKHPDNLDAYNLFLNGQKLIFNFNPDDNAKSRALFEKAIGLDPSYASAYAMLALTHFFDWQWYGSKTPKESYRKALDLARKAVTLDPKSAWAHWALGFILAYRNKHDQAIAQFEEGLKANPNNADLLCGSADPYVFNGQPEEAIKRVREAMRLNPYYPHWYQFQLGSAQYVARDYEGAIETLRKMSPLGVPRRIVAACLAYLGRMDEARAEAERFLKENPNFSASHWGSTQPFRYDNDKQHAVRGYLMAGLPK